MVQKISDVKIIQLDSEIDALLIENSLIKNYQPRYNIQLKDDKTYQWICIKNEYFPRVFYTRKKINDGSLYFGPYPSVKVVKTVLELVRENFEIRKCDHQLSEEKINDELFKTSVDFYIGNCKGCCQGEVSIEEYENRILNVKQVLNGYTTKVLKSMKLIMQQHASLYRFEDAERIKVKINNIKKFQSKSVVVDSNLTQLGVVNIISHEKYAFVNLIKVMNGAIIKSKTTVVQKKLDESEPEILSYLIAENFTEFFNDVKEIILPFDLTFDYPINFLVPKR